MRPRPRLLLALLASTAMAVFVTWPQAAHLGTLAAAHQDTEFSIWRLAWIAHAIATDPRHLFAANIFYPSRNALAYSDAMLVEGTLAAPLFWLHMPPTLAYNVMLLAGIAGSGVGAFLLAWELTGATAPSLVAAAVFSMAPYRVEHFMHLELQWALWIPLSFWAIERLLRRPSTAGGVLAGVFIWLQIASSVYYGVFLVIAIAVLLAVEAAVRPRAVVSAAPALAAGAVVTAVLTLPYLWFYLGAAREMGGRDPEEIARYSAHLSSYLSAPPQNWLRGWSASGPELNLFLGWTAMALALAGAVFARDAARVRYAAIAAAAFVFSLGSSGPIYRALAAAVPMLGGLRSPSRFAIVTTMGVAVLAALGVHAIEERASARHARWLGPILALVFAAIVVEDANTGMRISRTPALDGTVYRQIRVSGPGVVVELPMPQASALPGREPDYEYWSISHWHPLINGYSGYYPPHYIFALDRINAFPADDAVQLMKSLDVRYVVVHDAYLEEQALDSMLHAAGLRTDIYPYGRYSDGENSAHLFELRPARQ